MSEGAGTQSTQQAGASRPVVIVTRRLPERVEAALKARYDVHLNASDVPFDRAALELALRQADALVPTITDRLDATLLGLPGRRVRLIANYGAGIDHIDRSAVREAGVALTNTPGALTEATAELAVLLMLAASRRAMEGDRQLRAGEWPGWHPTHLIGRGLSGRVLGLIGFGRIAQATARRARALGLQIIYYSRSAASPVLEQTLGARRVASLTALATQADIVSIHVPGGVDTHHLIGAASLAAMKDGAILINTARGSVVDEQALAAALHSDRLFAVGLDVYEDEPAVHPDLLTHPRAVLLPHLGSATAEAREAMGMQVVANLDAFFAGRALPARVD